MAGIYETNSLCQDHILVIGKRLSEAEAKQAMKFIPIEVGPDEVVCMISRDDLARMLSDIVADKIRRQLRDG